MWNVICVCWENHNIQFSKWGVNAVITIKRLCVQRFASLIFRVCWTNPFTSWMWPSRPTATQMTTALQRAFESSLSQKWVNSLAPSTRLQTHNLTLSVVFVLLLQKSLLFEHGIRRLTFLVAQKVRARIHILWSPCGSYSLLPCMLTVKQFWTACLKLSTAMSLVDMPVSIFNDY